MLQEPEGLYIQRKEESMRLCKTILLAVLLPLFLTGVAYGQWIVLEDFESGLPTWDSIRNDGGFAWGISLDPDDITNNTLNHDLIDNTGLYGKNYIACQVYTVPGDTSLDFTIRNRGLIANGYSTMACVVRAGVYTAEDIFTDYSADGVFNNWVVLAHSREAPHTVGIWDNAWQQSPSAAVDTTGVTQVTVGFVAVAAFGSAPETYFDDLEYMESLPGPSTGVDIWEIYR
jgi:hypothetical protein